MPAVELHTTGRSSGRRRSVMLTSPVYQPDRVVLVASKGGDDRDPAWYRNLVANPDVELTAMNHPPDARRHRHRLRARSALAADRAGIPRLRRLSTATNRPIPVVIVEPR
jgi:deazaflavin-dependent oxidoreductase (nitroreductase family)